MELFLTSSVHAVAHDIAKRIDAARAKRLVFIDTAAEQEEGDKTWLANDRQALVDAGFVVADYTITGKSQEELEADLMEYDILYLSGGDTTYLLRQSQRSGFVEAVRDFIRNKGKTYIGTSAGSIIAGPRLPDYFSDEEPDLQDRSGYGFVNFTILPHWGSDHFKERYLGGRMKTVYRDDQVPLVLLTDNQYVHIRDDRMDFVDVKKA